MLRLIRLLSRILPPFIVYHLLFIHCDIIIVEFYDPSLDNTLPLGVSFGVTLAMYLLQ